MSDTVIRVENISKRYLIGHQWSRNDGLRHRIEDLLRSPFRWLQGRTDEHRSKKEEFWALKDISFEVNRGEVLGFIGRNGAGKSTLLKILSRITEPTTGRICIRGRVASLLEVGTGFHPELTGRENVFLNGAILGMSRVEIKKKFDEIVDFSGVEKFLDTPVKRYSSGMYVRLAFSVAAHLEPEILIVDEVLGVGDAEFQKKCMGKMQSVSSKEGRTVLFVSHNMVAVQSLCRRALFLRGGQLVADGEVEPIVTAYLKEFQGVEEAQQWGDFKTAPGTDALRIKSVQVVPEANEEKGLITMQTPIRIETEFWVMDASRQLHITYHLVTDQGITVLTSGSQSQSYLAGLHRAICYVPGNLLNSGGYILKLLVVENGNIVTYTHESVASFTVVDIAERKGSWLGREPSVVRPILQWKKEFLGQ